MNQHLKTLIIIISISAFLAPSLIVSASIMESKNYQLESDEINTGAIGEMRDFPGLSQQEKELALAINQNPKQEPVVIFTNKISAREIIFGSALALLILAFVYYVVFRKRLFLKQ